MRNAIAFLTSLLVVACVTIPTTRALSCPRIPSQPGDLSLLDLNGLRFFIDPSLDPEISSSVPFSVTIVDSGGATSLFNSRSIIEMGPAVPSSFMSIPLHAVAEHQFYYSVRIQSLNESVLNTFSDVIPSTDLILPGEIENITFTLCCKERGRVTLLGCFFAGTDSFHFLNGTYQTLGPFYFAYDCQAPSSSPCHNSSSLILVNFCASVNQTQALSASSAGEWELLFDAFGSERGLCVVSERLNGIHPLLQVEANIMRLPISRDFPELEFYLERTQNFSPVSYNISLSADNTSVVEQPISIPEVGLLTERQYLTLFIPCANSGVTRIRILLNVTAFSNILRYNTYDLFFYKDCTTLGTNVTIRRPMPNTAVIVVGTVVPIAGVMVLVVVVVVIIVLLAHRQKTRTKELEQLAKEQAAANLYTMTVVQNPFEFLEDYNMEYNFALLEVVDQLGEGAFGRVYKARAPGLQRGQHRAAEFVAVKSLKDDANNDHVDSFCKEVKVCAQFDHDHVIRLLGVCTISAQKCMIFEYMDLGSLLDLLHKSDPKSPTYAGEPSSHSLLQPEHLLPIVIQLCKGMEYLAELKFVHRDVATRNCLIDSNFHAKIADFGLSRNISAQNYYRIGSAKAYMPVRWMPPEALLYGKFTLKSDVWSFAVLMWEVYTFGQLPYRGMSDHEAIDCVKEAQGLDNPQLCPLGVYDIMRSCWIRVPSRRPTMAEVCQRLELFKEGKYSANTSYVNLLPGKEEDSSVPPPPPPPPRGASCDLTEPLQAEDIST